MDKFQLLVIISLPLLIILWAFIIANRHERKRRNIEYFSKHPIMLIILVIMVIIGIIIETHGIAK